MPYVSPHSPSTTAQTATMIQILHHQQQLTSTLQMQQQTKIMLAAEKQKSLPPHTLLQPEVWANILSYLPPDEISEASQIISNNNRSESSNHHRHYAIHQNASRIAVESMIQKAVQYFQNNKPKSKPTFPTEDQVESFLKTTIQASSSSQELLRQTYCRHAKQDWSDIYNDLYVVYDFLAPLSGFGKDPNETIAHAVHSIYLHRRCQ